MQSSNKNMITILRLIRSIQQSSQAIPCPLLLQILILGFLHHPKTSFKPHAEYLLAKNQHDGDGDRMFEHDH